MYAAGRYRMLNNCEISARWRGAIDPLWWCSVSQSTLLIAVSGGWLVDFAALERPAHHNGRPIRMKEPWIAPSILSADFARLGENVEQVLEAGADIIHFDVMDNHYVPNLSFGPMICKALRDYGIKSIIDVHLMVKPVDRLIPEFADAGADYITFHPEASEHIDRSLQLVKDNGCRAGLVFNPATPLSYLAHVMDKIDMILLMSVNPGYGGQSFIPSTLAKLKQARAIIDDSGLDIRLEVDGGVKSENIGEIAAHGADTFVAGSAIFGSVDYAATVADMKRSIASARGEK